MKTRLFYPITALFLIFGLAAPLAAIEGGGLFKTDLGLTFAKPTTQVTTRINNNYMLSLWMSQNLDKQGNYMFSTEGSFLFGLTAVRPGTGKVNTSVRADIDLLQFSFHVPFSTGSLDVLLGRFPVVDITTLIFNQKDDGLSLKYTHPKFSMMFHTGYTGLQNGLTTFMRSKTHTPGTTPVYRLAPGYANTSISFSVPVGPYRHEISAEFSAFFKLPKNLETYLYGTFSVTGVVFSNLYFLAVGSYGYSRQPAQTNHGFLTLGGLNYYFPQIGGQIGVDVAYASGTGKEFLPMSLIPAGVYAPYLYNGLLKTGIKASVKPLPELFLGVRTHVFFKDTGTAVSYAATEWKVEAQYCLMQSITFVLGVGQFIPKTGAMQTMVDLSGSISF